MGAIKDRLAALFGSAWHVNSDNVLLGIEAEIVNATGDTVAEVATALNTVGAGTITGAGIAGAFVQRGGAQSGSAFTDTTDTAANIIAALTAANIGDAWEFVYQNNTNAVATLSGGTGVTIAGNTVIPAGGFVRYLVVYSAAATIVMTAQEAGQMGQLPSAQFQTAVLTVGALAAGRITGADMCYLEQTGATPGAQTVRTAAQMLADTPGGYVGMVTQFRIINKGAGTFTLTADGGATVTITGTATIAQNVFRDYTLTFNSATTATIQSVGSGVSP